MGNTLRDYVTNSVSDASDDLGSINFEYVIQTPMNTYTASSSVPTNTTSNMLNNLFNISNSNNSDNVGVTDNSNVGENVDDDEDIDDDEDMDDVEDVNDAWNNNNNNTY